MKKLLHDWVGFSAAAMVAAALFYFLTPWAEANIGPVRTGILQIVIVGLFAVFGLIYFFRFVGVITRRDD